MKLYYSPGACSLAPHIVAEEAGLDIEFEKVNLKDHKTETGEDYNAVNPKGYVPALLLEDGSLLTENLAVLTFLGDRKPELGLTRAAFSIERYRLLEWLAFISTELHKSFAPLFQGGSDEVKTQAREKILKRLGYVEKQMVGPLLTGDKFSVADAYLFVILTWCDRQKIDLSALSNVSAYKARVAARPKVQAAMKAEGLLK